MPFGMGPRNCVGMRFALEEIKIALCTILKQYRFFPVVETPVRLKGIHTPLTLFYKPVFSTFFSPFSQEKLKFEDGFLTVSQPIFTTVGIEIR